MKSTQADSPMRRKDCLTNRSVAIAAVLIGLGGCTGSQGYEAVRSAGEAKAQCGHELTVAAQRACEKQYEMGYEEYLGMRQKAMSKSAQDPQAESR